MSALLYPLRMCAGKLWLSYVLSFVQSIVDGSTADRVEVKEFRSQCKWALPCTCR